MNLKNVIGNMFDLDSIQYGVVEWSNTEKPSDSARVVVVQDSATSLSALLDHIEKAFEVKIGCAYRPVHVRIERETNSVATEWDVLIDYVKD